MFRSFCNVELVSKLFPQTQVTLMVEYLGCIPCFMVLEHLGSKFVRLSPEVQKWTAECTEILKRADMLTDWKFRVLRNCGRIGWLMMLSKLLSTTKPFASLRRRIQRWFLFHAVFPKEAQLPRYHHVSAATCELPRFESTPPVNTFPEVGATVLYARARRVIESRRMTTSRLCSTSRLAFSMTISAT